MTATGRREGRPKKTKKFSHYGQSECGRKGKGNNTWSKYPQIADMLNGWHLINKEI